MLGNLEKKYANEMKVDIQHFIDQIKLDYGTVSTHEHKSRLHTYFSVNEDYLSFKIGEAAQAGAFAWDSPELEGLKQLVLEAFCL